MLSLTIVFSLLFAIAGNLLAIRGYEKKLTSVLTIGVLCITVSAILLGYAIYMGDFALINNTTEVSYVQR